LSELLRISFWETLADNPSFPLAGLLQNESVTGPKTLIVDYLQKSAERWPINDSHDVKAAREEGIRRMEEEAQKMLSQGDIEGVLGLLGDGARLDFVCDKAPMLREHGLFERALLDAWTGARTNIRNWSPSFTKSIFGKIADRERLLAAGQPLPGKGPFTLYRGVAGLGASRRVHGISWSSSVERAEWFAAWYADRFHLPNPCIYRTIVEREHILAYTNGRQEQEFLVLLPQGHRAEIFKRVSHPPTTREK